MLDLQKDSAGQVLTALTSLRCLNDHYNQPLTLEGTIASQNAYLVLGLDYIDAMLVLWRQTYPSPSPEVSKLFDKLASIASADNPLRTDMLRRQSTIDYIMSVEQTSTTLYNELDPTALLSDVPAETQSQYAALMSEVIDTAEFVRDSLVKLYDSNEGLHILSNSLWSTSII